MRTVWLLDAKDFDRLSRAMREMTSIVVDKTLGHSRILVRTVPASAAWRGVAMLLEVAEEWPNGVSRQYLACVEDLWKIWRDTTQKK